MTHSALIRLGAIATYDVVRSEPTRAYTELYRASGMRILDGRLAPFVCVNHDKKSIGRIRSLFDHDDWVSVNGNRSGGKWLVAHVEIDDPPSWLKRGTAASISYAPTWSREENGWTIIEKGLLREVSILSPSKRAAEPLAQVLTVNPVEPKRIGQRSAAAASSDPVAAGNPRPLNKHDQWQRAQNAPASREWWRTPAGQDAELRRRLEAAGYRDGCWETIIEQINDEIHFHKYGVPRPLTLDRFYAEHQSRRRAA